MQDRTRVSRSTDFRSDIEGLRGIAILVVVAFHCGLRGFGGGFVGVDIFFVLSGYLITGLLVREIRSESRLRLLDFYARRVRRLLPAAALVSASTLALGALFLVPDDLAHAARAARANSVYLSNVFFAVNSADYFAADVTKNPMLHTWSLAVEEQFYLFWPILILLGLELARSKRVLVALLCALTLGSLAASVLLTPRAPAWSFFGIQTRAWEFGLGGLAGLIPIGALGLRSSTWVAAGWLGIGAVLGSVALISETMTYPGWLALVPVLGTVVTLIAGMEAPHRGVGRALDTKPMQLLGKLSYSWYLWHWPLLVCAIALYPDITVPAKLMVAAAALGVAALAHFAFENPVRFHPLLVSRPTLTLELGALLMLFSFASSELGMRYAERLASEPRMRRITAAITDRGDLPRLRCVSLAESSKVLTCDYGDTSAGTVVVLFGDSHAMQWFTPLDQIARERGWRLVTVLRGGCPATYLDPARGGANSYVCARWRTDALQRIRLLRPQLVIVGNFAGYLDLARGSPTTPAFRAAIDQWRDGTEQTLNALVASAPVVVQLRDTPRMALDVPSCLARSARQAWYPGKSCTSIRAEAVSEAVFEAERLAAQSLSNVHFIDLTDAICSERECVPEQGSIIRYRDDSHLTATFTQELMPELARALDRVFPVSTAVAAKDQRR